jgi:hypothetical protein
VIEEGKVEPLGESRPFGATVDLVRLCPPDGGGPPLGMEKEAERGEGDAGVKPETDRAREWAWPGPRLGGGPATLKDRT